MCAKIVFQKSLIIVRIDKFYEKTLFNKSRIFNLKIFTDINLFWIFFQSITFHIFRSEFHNGTKIQKRAKTSNFSSIGYQAVQISIFKLPSNPWLILVSPISTLDTN